MAKLPFWANPSHWGLKGKELEIARAHHELSGYELSKRLLEIEYSGTITPAQELEYKEKLYLLDHNRGKYTRKEVTELITELRHPRKSVEFKIAMVDYAIEEEGLDEFEGEHKKLDIRFRKKDDPEYLLAKANLERKFDMISEREYAKNVATARNEPWVEIVDSKIAYGGSNGNQMSFELDWNQPFVDDLRRNGWTGQHDADVVDQWFTNLCMDMMSPFADTLPDDGQPTQITKRNDLGNDKSEYS